MTDSNHKQTTKSVIINDTKIIFPMDMTKSDLQRIITYAQTKLDSHSYIPDPEPAQSFDGTITPSIREAIEKLIYVGPDNKEYINIESSRLSFRCTYEVVKFTKKGLTLRTFNSMHPRTVIAKVDYYKGRYTIYTEGKQFISFLDVQEP